MTFFFKKKINFVKLLINIIYQSKYNIYPKHIKDINGIINVFVYIHINKAYYYKI